MGQDPQLRETDSGRLDSWKEIAIFLNRDARTVRRWERERGLPVHRVPGGERGGVFAYVSEIEGWLHSAQATPAAASGLEIQQPPTSVECSSGLEGLSETRPATALSAFLSLNSFPMAAANTASRIGPDSDLATAPMVHRSRRVRVYQAGALLALLLLVIGISAGVVRLRTTRLAIPAAHRPNPEALELYLRGRYYWNLRTEEGLNCALDLFTQSIVHDPQYAAAYAGLADSYLLLREYGHMPSSEAFPRAFAAAKRAVALDGSSPEAHRSLAFILRFWNWDMAAAEKEYRLAIALNPHDPQSHHWFATALLSAGRSSEALEQIDLARALDPGSVSVLADRGVILAAIDPHEGVAVLQQVEQWQPAFLSTHTYLSRTYLRLGDYEGFLRELQQAATLGRDPATLAVLNPMLDRARRSLPDRGPAFMLRGLAEDLAPLTDHGTFYAYDEARLFALAGEQGKAMHYLKLACDRRDPGFLDIEEDSAFNPLRSRPEFLSLIGRRDGAVRSGSGNSGQPEARLEVRRGL